jgi:hypothetical protein
MRFTLELNNILPLDSSYEIIPPIIIPVSKCLFSLSDTTFSLEGIRFPNNDRINGFEKKSRQTKDVIKVFLFRCAFFVSTAIANNTTIHVIGEIRKSKILER